jgi:hypothetical protein
LVERFDQDDQLAEYTLAVEYACDPQAAIDFGAELLKRRYLNLKLHNATALMLCRLGEREVAYQLWSVAINDTTSPENHSLKCGPLWNTWAWEMLQQGDFIKASYLLRALPQGEIDLVAFCAATDKQEGNIFEQLRLDKVSPLSLRYSIKLLTTLFSFCISRVSKHFTSSCHMSMWLGLTALPSSVMSQRTLSQTPHWMPHLTLTFPPMCS